MFILLKKKKNKIVNNELKTKICQPIIFRSVSKYFEMNSRITLKIKKKMYNK